MAQQIQVKRGNNANISSLSLVAGEPAFVLDTGKLYIGNGIDKVLINPDQGIVSNASTANKLTTARTITVAGDATGSVNFDGSSNVTLTITENNSGVTAGTYPKVTVNAKGEVTSGSALSTSDIPTLTLSKISDTGTSASKNVGTSSGNVPILDTNGKLDTNVLPGLALTTTNVVATQSEMLALTAEMGDLAVRTDLNKTFVLKANGASTLANWQELLTPTDSVTSVSGKTGAVTLTSNDVGLNNVTNESKATMFSSPTFTGSPTAPTATDGTNTTQVATTAFVTKAVNNKTSITGNAGTATKLATGRSITLSGDVTGNTTFDGSGNVTIATTVASTTSNIDGGTF